MKKTIAKKWVKLLRSGEFKQGQGRLHDAQDNTHCCLGVLCEMALVEGVCDYEVCDGRGGFDDRCGHLPKSVQAWADMNSRTGVCVDSSLSNLNDEGKTFAEIADIIEQHWKEL